MKNPLQLAPHKILLDGEIVDSHSLSQITQEEKDQLKKLLAGKETNEIAAEFKVARSTAHDWKKVAGLVDRNYSRKPAWRKNQDDDVSID